MGKVARMGRASEGMWLEWAELQGKVARVGGA